MTAPNPYTYHVLRLEPPDPQDDPTYRLVAADYVGDPEVLAESQDPDELRNLRSLLESIDAVDDKEAP